MTSEIKYQNIEEYFSQFPDDVETIEVCFNSDHLPFNSDHLPDLSRFYKLKNLQCHNSEMTCLPELPPTLEMLFLFQNKMTCLPVLPPSLKMLVCFSNHQMTCLSELPSTLDYLACSFSPLTRLPDLPSSLISLCCAHNQLTSLPSLPSSLRTLFCPDNQLTSLPDLPSTLKDLNCSNNQLTSLPPLPSTLTRLTCACNKLTYFPDLPSTLEYLVCFSNLFLDCYIKHIEHTNYTSMTDYITDFRNQINIINQFRELFYALKYKKQFLDLLWVRIREPKIRNKYKPENLIAMLEEKEDITLDELDELLDKW